MCHRRGNVEKNLTLLKSMVDAPLHELEAWFGGLRPAEPVGGEPFNWELFACVIASRAQHERSVECARMAVSVYEGLATALEGEWNTYLYSAMNLRAWMIRELGAREGDTVLDPERVVAWFQRTATLSFEEAVRWCAVWAADPESVPLDMLRTLRAIKSTLRVLDFVSEAGALGHHPELTAWLRLGPQLP
jgi:hypothetical protein